MYSRNYTSGPSLDLSGWSSSTRNYGKGSSFSHSGMLPNPSLSRVMNTDYGYSESSSLRGSNISYETGHLSPLRPPPLPTSFYGDNPSSRHRQYRTSSPTRLDTVSSSPSPRRKQISDSGWSSSRITNGDYFDYSPQSISSYSCKSSFYKSAPKRIDYSDYLHPLLQSKPVIRSDYKPRSRAEREKISTPLSRERKLIKFRETNDILASTKRKVSWALPDDELSLINELCEKHELHASSRDSSLTRLSSRGDSPRLSFKRSRDNSLTGVRQSPPRTIINDNDLNKSLKSLRNRSKSPADLHLGSPKRQSASRSRENSLTGIEMLPPPRKFSAGLLSREKMRKNSIEKNLLRRKSSDSAKSTEDILSEIQANKLKVPQVSIPVTTDCSVSSDNKTEILSETSKMCLPSDVSKKRKSIERQIPVELENKNLEKIENVECSRVSRRRFREKPLVQNDSQSSTRLRSRSRHKSSLIEENDILKINNFSAQVSEKEEFLKADCQIKLTGYRKSIKLKTGNVPSPKVSNDDMPIPEPRLFKKRSKTENLEPTIKLLDQSLATAKIEPTSTYKKESKLNNLQNSFDNFSGRKPPFTGKILQTNETQTNQKLKILNQQNSFLKIEQRILSKGDEVYSEKGKQSESVLCKTISSDPKSAYPDKVLLETKETVLQSAEKTSSKFSAANHLTSNSDANKVNSSTELKQTMKNKISDVISKPSDGLSKAVGTCPSKDTELDLRQKNKVNSLQHQEGLKKFSTDQIESKKDKFASSQSVKLDSSQNEPVWKRKFTMPSKTFSKLENASTEIVQNATVSKMRDDVKITNNKSFLPDGSNTVTETNSKIGIKATSKADKLSLNLKSVDTKAFKNSDASQMEKETKIAESKGISAGSCDDHDVKYQKPNEKFNIRSPAEEKCATTQKMSLPISPSKEKVKPFDSIETKCPTSPINEEIVVVCKLPQPKWLKQIKSSPICDTNSRFISGLKAPSMKQVVFQIRKETGTLIAKEIETNASDYIPGEPKQIDKFVIKTTDKYADQEKSKSSIVVPCKTNDSVAELREDKKNLKIVGRNESQEQVEQLKKTGKFDFKSVADSTEKVKDAVVTSHKMSARSNLNLKDESIKTQKDHLHSKENNATCKNIAESDVAKVAKLTDSEKNSSFQKPQKMHTEISVGEIQDNRISSTKAVDTKIIVPAKKGQFQETARGALSYKSNADLILKSDTDEEEEKKSAVPTSHKIGTNSRYDEVPVSKLNVTLHSKEKDVDLTDKILKSNSVVVIANTSSPREKELKVHKTNAEISAKNKTDNLLCPQSEDKKISQDHKVSNIEEKHNEPIKKASVEKKQTELMKKVSNVEKIQTGTKKENKFYKIQTEPEKKVVLEKKQTEPLKKNSDVEKIQTGMIKKENETEKFQIKPEKKSDLEKKQTEPVKKDNSREKNLIGIIKKDNVEKIQIGTIKEENKVKKIQIEPEKKDDLEKKQTELVKKVDQEKKQTEPVKKENNVEKIQIGTIRKENKFEKIQIEPEKIGDLEKKQTELIKKADLEKKQTEPVKKENNVEKIQIGTIKKENKFEKIQIEPEEKGDLEKKETEGVKEDSNAEKIQIGTIRKENKFEKFQLEPEKKVDLEKKQTEPVKKDNSVGKTQIGTIKKENKFEKIQIEPEKKGDLEKKQPETVNKDSNVDKIQIGITEKENKFGKIQIELEKKDNLENKQTETTKKDNDVRKIQIEPTKKTDFENKQICKKTEKIKEDSNVEKVKVEILSKTLKTEDKLGFKSVTENKEATCKDLITTINKKGYANFYGNESPINTKNDFLPMEKNINRKEKISQPNIEQTKTNKNIDSVKGIQVTNVEKNHSELSNKKENNLSLRLNDKDISISSAKIVPTVNKELAKNEGTLALDRKVGCTDPNKDTMKLFAPDVVTGVGKNAISEVPESIALKSKTPEPKKDDIKVNENIINDKNKAKEIKSMDKNSQKINEAAVLVKDEITIEQNLLPPKNKNFLNKQNVVSTSDAVEISDSKQKVNEKLNSNLSGPSYRDDTGDAKQNDFASKDSVLRKKETQMIDDKITSKMSSASIFDTKSKTVEEKDSVQIKNTTTCKDKLYKSGIESNASLTDLHNNEKTSKTVNEMHVPTEKISDLGVVLKSNKLSSAVSVTETRQISHEPIEKVNEILNKTISAVNKQIPLNAKKELVGIPVCSEISGKEKGLQKDHTIFELPDTGASSLKENTDNKTKYSVSNLEQKGTNKLHVLNKCLVPENSTLNDTSTDVKPFKITQQLLDSANAGKAKGHDLKLTLAKAPELPKADSDTSPKVKKFVPYISKNDNSDTFSASSPKESLSKMDLGIVSTKGTIPAKDTDSKVCSANKQTSIIKDCDTDVKKTSIIKDCDNDIKKTSTTKDLDSNINKSSLAKNLGAKVNETSGTGDSGVNIEKTSITNDSEIIIKETSVTKNLDSNINKASVAKQLDANVNKVPITVDSDVNVKKISTPKDSDVSVKKTFTTKDFDVNVKETSITEDHNEKETNKLGGIRSRKKENILEERDAKQKNSSKFTALESLSKDKDTMPSKMNDTSNNSMEKQLLESTTNGINKSHSFQRKDNFRDSKYLSYKKKETDNCNQLSETPVNINEKQVLVSTSTKESDLRNGIVPNGVTANVPTTVDNKTVVNDSKSSEEIENCVSRVFINNCLPPPLSEIPKHDQTIVQKPPPKKKKMIGLFVQKEPAYQTIPESSSSDDSGDDSDEEILPVNINQRQSTECNVTCHEKCEKHMANLCGVNQQLLSQVLDIVKKGRSSEYKDSNRKRLSSVTSTVSTATTCSNLSSSSEISNLSEDLRNSVISPLKKLKFRKYAIGDFQLLKLLGKGSFGKVLLGELKNSSMYFAIKCLKKDVVLEDDDVESTMIERRVLALGTQHPYMCKLYCTFQTDSHLCFVMEYLNGGDLMFHIQESGRFNQNRAMFYGAEIVSALAFLHKKGIIYRDIKVDNIMLDDDGHVHLVDFGMCKVGVTADQKTTTFCGTPDYIPPEIVTGQKYNQSVDWWSFGVLLYEMLTGRSPFNGTDEDELFWSICNEEPYYPRFLTKEAMNILKQLLNKNPEERLGMPCCPEGDIRQHAFFSSIDWNKLEKKQIKPPFKPRVKCASDTSNFDSNFTMDTATLTPVEIDILRSMNQEQFKGFSYTNPHITG